jgi:signal transduction histidine kinase
MARAIEGDQKAMAKLASIVRQLGRLEDLIESLLDVSRIVAGRFDLRPEELDLREVVNDLVVLHREQALRAGSEVVIEGDAHCAGNWDRLRLEQVLANLLSNAIKYGGGKPVRLAIRALGSDQVVVSIVDQGIGISEEDQGRIFERFERAVPPRNFGGLGLGLWIVRQMVTAMGGAISVRSKKGEGSEFTLVLPRNAQRAVVIAH